MLLDDLLVNIIIRSMRQSNTEVSIQSIEFEIKSRVAALIDREFPILRLIQ